MQRPTSTDPTQRPPHSRHSNRPREIVLPTPKLTGALLKPRNPDRAPEESVDDWKRERDNASSQHHSDARPQIASRSVSNITVPGIEIETPVSTCIFFSMLLFLLKILVSPLIHCRLPQEELL